MAHPGKRTPVFLSLTLLRTQSDDHLVTLVREGSEAAFAALVERYRPLVVRVCRRVLPEARAEDATQQAFVSAWTALRRGDDVRELRAWLLRIARNTALNAVRSPGYDYHELRDSLRVSEAPEIELERRDVMRRTLAGLAVLPERQREALVRSAIDGVPYADIAFDLGLTETAARQLVLRARTALRLAASAITPLPLLRWSAHRPVRSGGEITRIAELAASGSAASAGALLAKAGAVVVLAGSVVAGPGAMDKAPGNAVLRPDVVQAGAHTATTLGDSRLDERAAKRTADALGSSVDDGAAGSAPPAPEQVDSDDPLDTQRVEEAEDEGPAGGSDEQPARDSSVKDTTRGPASASETTDADGTTDADVSTAGETNDPDAIATDEADASETTDPDGTSDPDEAGASDTGDSHDADDDATAASDPTGDDPMSDDADVDVGDASAGT